MNANTLYHVVAVNERTGTVTLLTASPLPHGEAVTFKDKFNPHKNVRIQLQPMNANTPSAPFAKLSTTQLLNRLTALETRFRFAVPAHRQSIADEWDAVRRELDSRPQCQVLAALA